MSSALSGVAAYMAGSMVLTYVAAPLIVAFTVAGVPALVVLNFAMNAVFTVKLAGGAGGGSRTGRSGSPTSC